MVTAELPFRSVVQSRVILHANPGIWRNIALRTKRKHTSPSAKNILIAKGEERLIRRTNSKRTERGFDVYVFIAVTGHRSVILETPIDSIIA